MNRLRNRSLAPLLLPALLVIGGSTAGCATDEATTVSDEPNEVVVERVAEPINETCPRSDKPVVADSLTTYRGFVVGFCNTHCRDDFAANVDDRPSDTSFFDDLIAQAGAR